jgi:translocation and assembly module TamB
MTVFKKVLRILGYTLLALLAFAIGAVAVLTLTERGRENLAGIVSDLASSPERTVTISGIRGIWSGNFAMDQLVLADADGPWLAARGVEVRWSPMALLRSRFHAERIAAERIEFARLPKPSAQPPAEGGSSTLPVDISIDALDFPDIALGEAVTGGQVASAAAEGKVVAQGAPLVVAADLNVSRTDGTAGQVLASIDFAPDQNRLQVDLKASEPTGGILANLLQLPGQPAVDIVVSGSGPMADWRGNGTFSVDGSLITSVSATHRQTEAGRVVEAIGNGVFDRFLPERFRPLLAGQTHFDLAGTLTGDGGVDISRAEIESGALTATAIGAFNPAGATDVAIELEPKNGGVQLALGTGESPIDLTVGQASIRALGDGREPGVDVTVTLPSVSTRDVSLADLRLVLHSDAFNVAERSGPIRGAATAAQLTIDNPTVAPLVAGEIRAGLEGTLAAEALTLTAGTLASDAIDGRFSGTVSLPNGAITLQLDADFLSAALPAGARPLLGDKVALAAGLERDASGNVAARSLTVESGGLSATGSARLREGTVDAELSGTLADIAPLAPNASGALALTATAKGALLAPDVDLSLTSERLGFGDRALDDLDLRVTGRVDPANPQASVALKGAFQGQALAGNAVLAAAGGKREVRDIAFTLGQNRIAGALTLDESFLPAGTLDLDLADLGELAALAGQTVEGSARGSAAFSSGGGTPRVQVVLNSDSVRRGTLDVRSIAVDALVSDFLKAPAISGTLGATLADLLPGQPPADIRMSVEGTAADIGGTGTIAMEGTKVADFSLARRAADGSVEIKGTGAFARFAPERARRLLDGQTTFDVAATTGEAGALRIERAELANGALRAQASGSVDPAGPVDLTVQLGTGTSNLPLSFGTDEAPIDITLDSATLRAVGDIDAPRLDIAARLPQVATNHVQLAGMAIALRSDGFNLASRTGPMTGSVTAASLTIDNPTVAPLVAGEIRAEIDGALSTEALRVERGVLRSDAIDGGFSGTVSLPTGVITLDLKADVLSAALPAAVRPVLGEQLALSTSLERDAGGKVSANALALQSGGLTGQGVIQLTGGQLDADIKGALTDISPLAEQASGSVAFSATAKGALSAPDVTLSVTSDRMTVAARAIENLALNASGRTDLANPEANVTLTGTVAGEKLDGRAVLNTADGRRAVRDLNLSLGRNRIAGALALDENFVPEGTVDFDLPDLGRLAALALETVEGSVRGNAAFTRVGGRPQARISANAPAITRGDLSVRSVSIDATISDYFAQPGVAGTVRADEVRSGGTVIRGISVDLSREGDWTRFSGGAEVNDIPARAAGRVRSAGGTTTVELASAEATMRGIRATLARPSTVRIAGGQTRLDNLALAVGGGTATVSGTAGANLALDVALARLPASVANNFAPGLDAGGTISGTVNVSGAAANPTVRYSADWGGAETAQTRGAGVGPVTIRSTGTFAANRLTFDANLGNGSGLSIRGGGSVAVAQPPRLDLRFEGAVPFSLIESRLAAQALSLSGTANVNLTVTGAAAAPVIGGSIRTSGARLVDARSGIALNDIAADVGIASGRATINRLSGSLSSGGTVSASGTVGIEANQGFPADIAIRLADARYTDGEMVATTLSGNLAVKGPLLSAPRLTGTIDLARTVITVPERLPGSLAALDVQHRNAPEAVRKQAQALRPASASGGGGSGLEIDITVNAPQRIFIQGRGLDAELGGSLRLVGPASSPQATGEFDLRRGRLALLGRRLTFTHGTLTFAGSLVPYLDLSAESTAGDATVTVLVSGPANNPKFSFSSVPALPEDEVLARLIFGRPMSNLSPLQIAQLADAAAQLAGGGGTTSLLTSLRERLGVDDLDLKTNEEGDTTVSVGKYLNDRTYLTIETGDRAGSGRAAIDLDVGRGVKLRGEARDDGEAKGGIFYEREY